MQKRKMRNKSKQRNGVACGKRDFNAIWLKSDENYTRAYVVMHLKLKAKRLGQKIEEKNKIKDECNVKGIRSTGFNWVERQANHEYLCACNEYMKRNENEIRVQQKMVNAQKTTTITTTSRL